tara:strand:- start:5309 stop:5731 length:423 start_codon:yes stop_codon:yes gene_type:complete
MNTDTDPDPFSSGRELLEIPMSDWTPGMVRVATFCRRISPMLLDGKDIWVSIANDASLTNRSVYTPHRMLILNSFRLGKDFFEDFPSNMEELLDILLHELGHEYCRDHSSPLYYNVLTRLGAKLTMLALKDPVFLNGHKS